MLETFVEFTFEAAHKVPPYSGIHGHTFKAVIFLKGQRDPVYGWTHNLYDVEDVIGRFKRPTAFSLWQKARRKSL